MAFEIFLWKNIVYSFPKTESISIGFYELEYVLINSSSNWRRGFFFFFYHSHLSIFTKTEWLKKNLIAFHIRKWIIDWFHIVLVFISSALVVGFLKEHKYWAGIWMVYYVYTMVEKLWYFFSDTRGLIRRHFLYLLLLHLLTIQKHSKYEIIFMNLINE